MAALVMLKEYYGEPCAGFSIPASEHSTMTSWGREKELDAMRNMLEKYPKGVVACVSDSYDVFNACENYWGTELKEMIDLFQDEGTNKGHITYNEFLPRIIGLNALNRYDLRVRTEGYSNDYDSTCNPSIFNEFATQAKMTKKTRQLSLGQGQDRSEEHTSELQSP